MSGLMGWDCFQDLLIDSTVTVENTTGDHSGDLLPYSWTTSGA